MTGCTKWNSLAMESTRRPGIKMFKTTSILDFFSCVALLSNDICERPASQQYALRFFSQSSSDRASPRTASYTKPKPLDSRGLPIAPHESPQWPRMAHLARCCRAAVIVPLISRYFISSGLPTATHGYLDYGSPLAQTGRSLDVSRAVALRRGRPPSVL
jgi:hypothetical protein